MSERIVVLPNREEMLQRLLAVDDNSDFQETLYPVLLLHAGAELTSRDVVKMLTLAIDDYTKDMPSMIAVLVGRMISNFIDAVVVDPEAAKEARDFFRNAK